MLFCNLDMQKKHEARKYPKTKHDTCSSVDAYELDGLVDLPL